MTSNQESKINSRDLLEMCISAMGSSKKVSEVTGYTPETICRFRNGKKPMSKTAHKLFWLAMEVGYLKQENAHLKRKLGR